MRLLIIRHADPDYPNNTITPAGHLEASALAERLGRFGLDGIFTSPLGRARDTARYAAEATGLEPAVLPWTVELDWPCLEQEGFGSSTIWDLHGHRIHRRSYSRETWLGEPPFDHPGYRSGFGELQRASDGFLASLGYERQDGSYAVRAGNRRKIAVFCHAGFGLTWLSHLLNIPAPLVWGGFFLPPSSVTTILFDERSLDLACPRCLGVGDVSHLYARGLPVQPAGLKANLD